jgi:AcrR family transcriptional regulator
VDAEDIVTRKSLGAADSLRERKQWRTRNDIVSAAMELFAQHGYDAVTVTDIARRAEVGRTTFFRYFPDKQDVLFADEADLHVLLAAAMERAAGPLGPLDRSLSAAVHVVRAGTLALADALAHQALANPARHALVTSHPQLEACTWTKQRAYIATATRELVRHGADEDTAALAAHLATACYGQAQAESVNEPQRLPEVTARAFDRLGELGSATPVRMPAAPAEGNGQVA